MRLPDSVTEGCHCWYSFAPYFESGEWATGAVTEARSGPLSAYHFHPYSGAAPRPCSHPEGRFVRLINRRIG